MSAPRSPPSALALRVYLTLSSVVAVAAAITAATRWAGQRRQPEQRAGPESARVEVGNIAAEALVFRRAPGGLSLRPGARRERAAHPRTEATYRYLRASPGAPPRIPHPLDPAEFRTGRCGTCHERGGYSARFTAYTPLTPHPELTPCQSCHVADGTIAGFGPREADPSTRCPRCHTAEGPARTAWSRVAARTLPTTPAVPRTPGAPPPIPHDRLMRESCQSCHTGPAAVAEIRTSHPERGGCRSCHVEVDPAAGEFTRRPPAGGPDIGDGT